MKRTNIHLTPDQRLQLDRLRRHTGLTVAEHIRRAVDAYLAAEMARRRKGMESRHDLGV